MDKNIFKTIIVTLIAIICVLSFTWGTLTIFAPYKVGKFAQDLGAEKVAIAYFETDYKRNKSNDRLYNLTASGFYAKKYSKTIKYGLELLKRDSFKNLYTNDRYIDVCIYVLQSKYLTNHEDLIAFLLNHSLHYNGEKIVDFAEYKPIITSIMFLANSKGDKHFLEILLSTLLVDEKIGQDSFEIEQDYIIFTTLIQNLQKLING